MKSTVYLFNFARGDLIVEGDLVEAVQQKRIAGAVLDVFTAGPLRRFAASEPLLHLVDRARGY